MQHAPRVWHVFAAYVAAIAGIFAVSGVAVVALVAWYPDVPERTLLESLPGLVAGGLASSTALLLTVLLMARPLDPPGLRLLPGWEDGWALAVMTLGMLALGEALDALTTLAGLGDRGSLAVIRRALEGAMGPELFAAVVVIGPVAGTAEEIFFRGYMQTALRAHWGPTAAVAVTSVCFAILHVDASVVHTVLALVLGAYLGFVVEATGSVLPAIVCHVVNNVIFTLQTALGGTVADRRVSVALAVGGLLVSAACAAWVWRAARHAAPLPPRP